MFGYKNKECTRKSTIFIYNRFIFVKIVCLQFPRNTVYLVNDVNEFANRNGLINV